MATWHRCHQSAGGSIASVRCSIRCFNAPRLLTSSNSALALTEPCTGSEQMYHTVDEVDLTVMDNFRPAHSSSLHMQPSTSVPTSQTANRNRTWKSRSRLKGVDAVAAPDQSMLPTCSHVELQAPELHHAWPEETPIELQPALGTPSSDTHLLHTVSDTAATAAYAAAVTLTQGTSSHQHPQAVRTALIQPLPTSQAPVEHLSTQPASTPQFHRAPTQSLSAQEQRMAACLTQRIMSTSSPQELHHVLASSRCAVNHIHVSAALKQLVHLGHNSMQPDTHLDSSHTGSPGPPSRQHQPSHNVLHKPNGQQLAAMQQQRLRQQMGSQLAVDALQLLPHMRMWELSVIMSNLVRLNVPLKKSYYIKLMTHANRLFDDEDTTVQGLAELLCAVARCGMKGLRVDWGTRYCAAVEQRWQSLDLRAASRILHHMARLRFSPPNPTWWLHLVHVVASHAEDASPQDVSNALWALARLRHKVPPPQDAVEALCKRAQVLWPLFNERETSVMLWSVARLEAPVNEAWREAAVMQVQRHMENLNSGLPLALTCYALGLLGWRLSDRQSVEQVLQRVQHAGFSGLSEQGLGLLAYGLACMGHRPDAWWLAALHKHVESHHPVLHSATEQLLGAAYLAFDFSPQTASPQWRRLLRDKQQSSTHQSPAQQQQHHELAHPEQVHHEQQLVSHGMIRPRMNGHREHVPGQAQASSDQSQAPVVIAI